MLTLNLKKCNVGQGYNMEPYGTKRDYYLCKYEFDEFFVLPANATDVRLKFTKQSHPDAYLMFYKRTRRDHNIVTKLDTYKVRLYLSAATAMKRLIADGYRYVRVDYRTK